MPETIRAYLETVQEQIRWKRARPILARELERHLEDQRDEFLREGKSPEEAERLAVQDMGDPVTVGMELDAVHRPRPQWGLLALAAALAAAGVLLRLSLHAGRGWAEEPMRVKTLLSLVLGAGALLGMYFLDISRLARHARAVYMAALAAGVLALPFWSFSRNGYYTSYIALFYPTVYVLWLYSFRGKGWRGLLLTVLGGISLAAVCAGAISLAALAVFLISALTLTLCAVAQDWFGTGKAKGTGAVLAGTLCAAVPAFWRMLPALRGRLEIAFHPELDPLGKGWRGMTVRQFMEGIPLVRSSREGRAVLIGARSFTTPSQLFDDFLPISIAVRWGWLPFLLLLAALAALLFWMLARGLRQRQRLGRLVVLAVVLTLGLQTLFSVVLNLGIELFSAGMPLVVGNLQSVIDMALIGLALSVFRGESIACEAAEEALPRKKRLRIRIEYQ